MSLLIKTYETIKKTEKFCFGHLPVPLGQLFHMFICDCRLLFLNNYVGSEMKKNNRFTGVQKKN